LWNAALIWCFYHLEIFNKRIAKMREFVSASAKAVLLGAAAAVLVGACLGIARADPVTAGGSTAGCFNCGSVSPFATTSSLLGPPYDGDTFDVLMSAGNPSSSPAVITRGAFQFQINSSHASPGNERAPAKTASRASITPEPTAILLLGAGILGIAAKLRRRKKN